MIISEENQKRLIAGETVGMCIMKLNGTVPYKGRPITLDIPSLTASLERYQRQYMDENRIVRIGFSLFPEVLQEDNGIGILRNPTVVDDEIVSLVTLNERGRELVADLRELRFSMAFTDTVEGDVMYPIDFLNFTLKGKL